MILTIDTDQATKMHRSILVWIARLYIVIAIPVLLTLLSIRLIMTPIFLSWEYNRADFAPDFYGFTNTDRQQYAPYALDYLLYDNRIEFLSILRLPIDKCWKFESATETHCLLYNARELSHLEDVKVVTQLAFGSGIIGSIIVIGVSIFLANTITTRVQLAHSLMAGGVLTLVIIAGTLVFAVLAWDAFFTGFHQVFFESGTWRFEYSDTLIRLFPEQFWSDAALGVSLLTFTGAIILLVVASRWVKYMKSAHS